MDETNVVKTIIDNIKLEENNKKILNNIGDGILEFTSNDSTNATSYTSIDTLSTGSTISTLFNKISTMFKNIRYLYSMVTTLDSDIKQLKINNNLLPVDFIPATALTENITINKNIGYKYGDLCYVHVEFKCEKRINSDTAIISIPVPAGDVKPSPPNLRELNGTNMEPCGYNNTSIITNKYLSSGDTYIFEWVYFSE